MMRQEAGEHYVLRVAGDAMKDESIEDGDFIIVLRRDNPALGEMAVLLIGDDAMMARWGKEEAGSVQLTRSTGSFTVNRADVQVQGVCVGLMRKW